MRWYVVGLLAIAFLVGTLFQATEQTGMRIWNMFATMGIFLFGLVGSLALSRLQMRSGLKNVEEALKRLEPDWVITDWYGQSGDGRPDYLLVGPGGVAAVCIDQTAQSTFAWRARSLVARGRERTTRASGWVRSRLDQAGPTLPLGLAGTPVLPVLLLARRRALPEYSLDGIAVVNPDSLAQHLQAATGALRLSDQDRFRLTRYLRGGETPAKVGGEHL